MNSRLDELKKAQILINSAPAYERLRDFLRRPKSMISMLDEIKEMLLGGTHTICAWLLAREFRCSEGTIKSIVYRLRRKPHRMIILSSRQEESLQMTYIFMGFWNAPTKSAPAKKKKQAPKKPKTKLKPWRQKPQTPASYRVDNLVVNGTNHNRILSN